MDLVILVGGKGTRIAKKLKNLPKPMVKFYNKPFLSVILQEYLKFPFEKVYLLCGYRGNIIFKKYHNKYLNLAKIKCVTEKYPLGTGGALNLIKKKISKKFVLTNGDSFLDYDFTNFFNSNNNHQNTMVLINNLNYKSNKKLANLKLVKKNFIKFSKNAKLMNAGIYFLNKKIFKKFKNEVFSIENDFFESEIKKKKLLGKLVKNYFIDIGTYPNLKLANQTLAKAIYHKIALFDLDYLLNQKYICIEKKSLFISNNLIRLFQYYHNKGHQIYFMVIKKILSNNHLKKIKGYLFKKNLKSFFIFFKKKQDHLNSIKDLNNINIDWKNSLYIGNHKIKLKCDKYKIDDIIGQINFKKKLS